METSLKQDGCEIELDDTSGRITVKGSAAQIRNLQTQTQYIVGHFCERPLKQNKFSFLKTTKGLSRVETLLSRENLVVEILCTDQDIVIYAVDNTQVHRALMTLEDAIDELTLSQSK